MPADVVLDAGVFNQQMPADVGLDAGVFNLQMPADVGLDAACSTNKFVLMLGVPSNARLHQSELFEVVRSTTLTVRRSA